MKLPERLKSRKLWMAVAAIVAQLLLVWTGDIDGELGLKTIVGTVLGYLGAQGYTDAHKK